VRENQKPYKNGRRSTLLTAEGHFSYTGQETSPGPISLKIQRMSPMIHATNNDGGFVQSIILLS